ncbi:hypothetical protein [Endozoicomonas sp. 8E]|uniref:hypothetical protein n=1 Tax=Endozoicomonas sp. 8E TaxID=3035692 RepID=UPI0029394E62|nr:hypothetical protein [Endozoicomonas sp. 8E]WOG26864.1 hypothetical protein P6910_20290 [Endozoicomonas sp. 8E]
MNNVDNNSGVVGLFSPKPEKESPEAVCFGRTTTASGKIDSSSRRAVNGGDPDHSSQRLGAVASTSTSLEQRVVSSQESTEIDAANKKARETVKRIINYLDNLKQEYLINKDRCSRNTAPAQGIQVLENVIQLLEYLEPRNISKSQKINDGTCLSQLFNSYYDVSYEGEVLFSVTNTLKDNQDSFSGVSWSLATETTPLFDELYYAPGAPGYQSAKTEFKALQTKSLLNDPLLSVIESHESKEATFSVKQRVFIDS